MESFARALDRIPESVRCFSVTEKTEAGVHGWIVILDDFLDATGRARDGQRPIFQTVHRTQSAGLDPRWDQSHVRSGFDQVSELFVVSSPVGKLRWVFPCGDRERGLISRIAFAENNQPHII